MSTQTPATAPYGTWESPLTPQALTASTVSLSQPRLDRHASWWVERRPELDGCSVLVRCADGEQPCDVPLRRTPDDAVSSTISQDAEPAASRPVDVRTRVHEYGGEAYDIAPGIGVAVDGADSALLAFDVPGDGSAPDGVARSLTPPGGARYGAPAIDLRRRRVVAVREDHDREDHAGRPVNELVSVPLDGSARDDASRVLVLLTGRDFVASPAVSEGGDLVAVLAWDDPEMPWTGAELHVLELDEAGRTLATHHVAGGDGVAAQDPAWGPDGDLLFVDDSSGWANPYRLEGATEALVHTAPAASASSVSGASGGDEPSTASRAGAPTREVLPDPKTGRLRAIHRCATDFGLPQWGLGPRGAAVLDDYLVAIASEDGKRTLVALRRDNGQAEEWTGEFEPVGGLDARDGRVLVIAANATAPAAVLRLDVPSASTRVLRASAPPLLEPADISVAQPLTWDSPQDDGEIARAHGFWYPPTNAGFAAPDSELPPAVVLVHGGPTAAVSATYNPLVQFWTSRGIGVLDVNYGGSTGYGRAYQDRLEGAWGIVDVADCVAGAAHVVAEGLADPRRVAISGGSAGGLTVVTALATSDVFTAGLVSYGVMDLTMLARDTHKFESRYLDGLIAPWPEGKDIYEARSPLARLGGLTAPVLVQQGTEDPVVPPNQSQALADALRAKGLPVALVEYEGEAHGFRKAANIQAAAIAELTFLGQVWGFEPAGGLPKVEVENLTSQ